MNPISKDLLLVGASAIAGAVNSVAGGGTMLTFPTLIAMGQLSTVANATNTVALWPGQLSSLWGYSGEIRQNARAIVPLLVVGLVGGVAGAYLLVKTPSKVFDHIVPFLVLLATILFMAQEPLSRWQKTRIAQASKSDEPSGASAADNSDNTLRMTPGVGIFLLAVAVYGGYFGAGIGILTLAALGFLGMKNIHQMNGIKAAFTLGINGVAALIFATQRIVDWRVAGIMAIGAIFGGYAGSGIAKRIGQRNVRRLVIAIGLGITFWLLYRSLFHPT